MYPPGHYTIKLRGKAGFEEPLSAEVDLTLILTNPCETSILQTNLADPFQDVSYTVGFNAIEYAFSVDELVRLNTQVDCGPIGVGFVNLDGSKPNNKLFMFDESKFMVRE